ncbi:MAG: hypothetical protein K0S41_1191 [Anaerocolumna sp.]|jgi:hypothetical protein|nr:hypothetical protein [Anaerocolumna sp.]
MKEFEISEITEVIAPERDAIDYLMIFMSTACFVAMVC